MESSFNNTINSLLKWSFYLLFFAVPLIMWPSTFELYEFNKMWFVFGMSIIIAFLWGSKIIANGKIEIRRTPLDIPIALFIISQIISTIFSMDPHVSFWGYYSRFNGGLLSTFAYFFLYYAFASNLTKDASVDSNARHENGNPISYKLLFISLLSGIAVTLWGLPSHFGADPTCYVFRGTFDVSCWTDAFQPTVRIFSTLGQPNWMGTFLAALLPITLGFGIFKLKENKKMAQPIFYLILASVFFLALIYTRSQSSFLGLVIGLLVFFAGLIFIVLKESKQKLIQNKQVKYIVAAVIAMAIVIFFVGNPINSLNKYTTLSGITSMLSQPKEIPQSKNDTAKTATATTGGLENDTNLNVQGGSESSQIRLIVWQGAIEIFREHPLFGTGVETFAFAYYQVKPLAHNLTSEWDYLYNKAHNEYLNYLATTGAFGLLTYLAIIFLFFYVAVKSILKNPENKYLPISLGIIGGFIAILISNFFGFSVVVINLYLFIFPLLFLDLEGNTSLKRVFAFPKGSGETSKNMSVTPPQAIIIVLIGVVALYYEIYLFNFWRADIKYAMGNNLDKASQFAQAYTYLTDAVKILPSEDLYKDELSINMATISLLLAEQKQSTQAAQFGMQAKQLSDAVVAAHPNSVVYLKTRARVAYALSDIDPSFLDLAISTIEDAKKLAPTDAKLVYNEGLFLSQKGDSDQAIKFVEEAIKLKPNYLDAYYTLALFYSQKAKLDPQNSVMDKQKAKDALEFILKDLNPNHKASLELLKTL